MVLIVGNLVDAATTPMSPSISSSDLKKMSDHDLNASHEPNNLVTPSAIVSSVSNDGGIRFSDTDEKISTSNVKETVSAPKDIETLEKISNERDSMLDDDDDDDDKLTIHDAGNVTLDVLDVNDINKPVTLSDDILIPDIEVI